MPRPKGSKNKPKIVKASVDFAAQIAEKQAAKEAAAAEIASITANIDALKADLKTKKAELKSIDKEIARIEAKKVKAETKAAESAKKAEAEDVLKKLRNHKVNTNYIRKTPDGLGTWLAVFDNEGDVVAYISKRPNLMPILDILEEN